MSSNASYPLPRRFLSASVFPCFLTSPVCNALGRTAGKRRGISAAINVECRYKSPSYDAGLPIRGGSVGGVAVTSCASTPFLPTVFLTPLLLRAMVALRVFLARRLIAEHGSVTVFLTRPLLGVTIAPVSIHVACNQTGGVAHRGSRRHAVHRLLRRGHAS